MAFGVQFEVDKASLRQALVNLQALPAKHVRPAVRKGIEAASKEVRQSAKAYAPRRTGHLRASMIVKMIPASKMKKKTLMLGVVGPRNKKYADGSNPGKYSHLVEKGTQAHVIRPKNKKVLTWKGKVAETRASFDPSTGVSITKTGRMKRFQAFTQKVNHPGFAGRRFLHQAASQAQGAAIRAFTYETQRAFNRSGVAA